MTVALVAGIWSSSAPAQPVPTVEERLDALERRNQELEREVRSLREAATARDGQPTTMPAAPPASTGDRRGQPAAPKGEPGLPAESTTGDLDARMKAYDAAQWKLGLKPNGGGVFLRSPDDNFQLRLLGYAQAQGTLTDGSFTNSFDNGDFRVRRARLDWIAEFVKRYELFIELDGAPTGGTTLVEARLNWKLIDDALQLRLGKFTTPFSTENWRSSRAIDTVERYIALNAMFSLPGLDVQNGAMLWGTAPVGGAYPGSATGKPFRPKLTWYAGAYNGNSSAGNDNAVGNGGNARDSSDDKEFQAKLTYQATERLAVGLGFDHNRTPENEALTLASLSGTPYVRVTGVGDRTGAEADFYFESGRFSLRGEAIAFDFTDADLDLLGGFVQAGYFLTGDATKGFQPIVRLEYAALDGDAVAAVDGDSITALTAGFNWYVNGNVRVQVNAIAEHFDGPGNASVGAEGTRGTLLSQVQFRF